MIQLFFAQRLHGLHVGEVAMKWARDPEGAWVSDCGRYQVAPRYVDGYFAWRGREISTDKLVCASLDPEFVKGCCERHAVSVNGEDAA